MNHRDGKLINVSNVKFNQKNGAFVQGKRLSIESIATIKRVQGSGGSISQASMEAKVSLPTARKYYYATRMKDYGREEDTGVFFNSVIYNLVTRIIILNKAVYQREIVDSIEFVTGRRPDSSTVSRIFKRLGYKRKRLCIMAIYRNTTRVQDLRRAHSLTFIETGFNPRRIVYLDETHISNKDLQRNFGWVRPGERNSTYFHRYDQVSYTMIALMGVNGVYFHQIYNTSGFAIDARRFLEWLRLAVIRLPPGTILGLDNARIHKTREVLDFLRGYPHIFLPPYSPDFNPIELFFNHLKKKMKSYFRTRRDVREVITEITNAVPHFVCENFFRKSFINVLECPP